MISSFAIKLNPFAEKQIQQLSAPDREDWRKLTADVWRRPFDKLPLDVDLPRLAGRVSIEDHRTCPDSELLPADPYENDGDPLIQRPEVHANVNLRPSISCGSIDVAAMNAATAEAARKSYRAVCELLYEMMFVLGGGREKADSAKKEFMSRLPEDCDLAVQRAEFKQFLSEVYAEDTRPGRCLKAVNQAIIAPGNKEALGNLLPGVFFKDSQQRPWQIVIRVFDDHTEVSHLRGQVNLVNKEDQKFSFILETLFIFDKDFNDMTDAHLYVVEYAFADTTSRELITQFSKEFDKHARPKPTDDIPPARVISNVGRRAINYASYLSSQQKAKEADATTTATTE